MYKLFQASSQKPLGESKPNLMWSLLGLTLTYFTTMLNLAKHTYIRHRYQVSVYWTIGPLVNWILFIFAGNDDMHKSLDEFEIRPDATTGFHGNR